MPRRFRFLIKKRGSHRSVSDESGALGLALFMAVLFFGGMGLLVYMIRTMIVPEYHANWNFRPTECEVLAVRVGERETDRSTREQREYHFRPEVLIRYEIDGRQRELWTYAISTLQGGGYSSDEAEQRRLAEAFTIGERYPCWYDPAHPEIAVVFRKRAWIAWALLSLPISFLIIGGTGLGYAWVNWGSSAERRAALAQQAEQLVQYDLLAEHDPTAQEYPYVPDHQNITNSPGVRLAYRLPQVTSGGWAAAGLIAGALLWNAVTIVFLITSFTRLVGQSPDWFLLVLSGVFVTVGFFLTRTTIRFLLAYAAVGPTLLEISEHPLAPGEACRLSLSQSGTLQFRRFEVTLICEELATYQQGTNTRTERRRVHQETLLEREDFSVRPDAAWEVELPLAIPLSAMHSFRSPHNEVLWRVLVHGDAVGRPPFQREFPLIVRPAGGRSWAA